MKLFIMPCFNKSVLGYCSWMDLVFLLWRIFNIEIMKSTAHSYCIATVTARASDQFHVVSMSSLPQQLKQTASEATIHVRFSWKHDLCSGAVSYCCSACMEVLVACPFSSWNIFLVTRFVFRGLGIGLISIWLQCKFHVNLSLRWAAAHQTWSDHCNSAYSLYAKQHY